ncbi:MAG: SsrA-binding protein SmpB [Dehalococcoidia bacterium]|nr:SsrA-binding protein SmpB [Dehalococcoidia bacterium]
MAKPSAAKAATANHRDIAVNRRALHDYEILDRYEAGVVLTGSEIKSVREGKVSLQEAFARPEKGDLWLNGAHIAEYAPSARFGHEPRRPRRLLLHRSQIRELTRQVNEKGLTIIPLRLYLKDGLAKVEIAVARGRRQYDKREVIAKRDADREIERALRQRTTGVRTK